MATRTENIDANTTVNLTTLFVLEEGVSYVLEVGASARGEDCIVIAYDADPETAGGHLLGTATGALSRKALTTGSPGSTARSTRQRASCALRRMSVETRTPPGGAAPGTRTHCRGGCGAYGDLARLPWGSERIEAGAFAPDYRRHPQRPS